jgi:hypothetical protein
MSDLITIALIGLAVIILVPLVAPVRVRVRLTPDGSRIRTQWMLQFIENRYPERVRIIGFWKYELARQAFAPKRRKKPPVEKKKPETEGPPWTVRARTAWDFRLVLRRALLVAVRLVGRLIRSFRFQGGHLEITMGTGDPAKTGMLTGLYYAVQPQLRQRFPRLMLAWRPDFDRSIFGVDGEFKWRLIPVEPVYHLLRALATLPWRGLWKLRKAWSQ